MHTINKLYIWLVILLGITGCKQNDLPGHNPGAPIVIDRFIPEEGQGGTEMMIFGRNFSGDTTGVVVTVNGARATVTGINHERILLTVPEGAGTGLVEVQIGNQKGSSTVPFKFPPVFQWRVTTLAGSGQAGYADGTGSAAQFRFDRAPGLAVDAEGNVYVADAGNHCIRKITPQGEVSTFAGTGVAGYADGGADQAQFDTPFDVAVDQDNNVFVADTWNAKLRKITPEGTVSTVTGVGDIVGIAIDPRNNQVLVSSLTNGAIYRVEDSGNLTTVLQGLGWVSGLAINEEGILFVVETGKSVIHRLDLKSVVDSPGVSTIIAGMPGQTGWEDGPGASAKFDRPWGIAVSPVTGMLFVAGDAGPYGGPWYDDGGNNTNQCIRQINPRGWEVSTFAGAPERGYADGSLDEARFNNPTGVAVGPDGSIYVVDANNHSIRKIVREEVYE
ncbi:IPT/TIG domain-containing protein [Parapedobacter defluvii]|uniref:IPT/TIG domain-containing protein n=1 Tax=Parapedobacter defluvii TaxID=2045106 RepID=UPI00333F17B4